MSRIQDIEDARMSKWDRQKHRMIELLIWVSAICGGISIVAITVVVNILVLQFAAHLLRNADLERLAAVAPLVVALLILIYAGCVGWWWIRKQDMRSREFFGPING